MKLKINNTGRYNRKIIHHGCLQKRIRDYTMARATRLRIIRAINSAGERCKTSTLDTGLDSDVKLMKCGLKGFIAVPREP